METIMQIQVRINEEGALRNQRYAFSDKFTLVSELLQNARRAGATHVEIDHDAATKTLRVADNGGGIAKEHQARIFDPFWTTKGEGRGTGLGLSIVRNIVQQHRGEIHVDSAPGKGTTFTIVLLGKSQA